MDYEVKVTVGEMSWYRGVKDGIAFGGGESDCTDLFHRRVLSVLIASVSQLQLRLDRNDPVRMLDGSSCTVEVENEIPVATAGGCE